MAFKTYVSSFLRIKKNSETVERTHRTHVIHVTRVIQHHSAETGRLESRDETGFILLTNHNVVLERSELFESPAGARTQLGAAVVADDPGEHHLPADHGDCSWYQYLSLMMSWKLDK